MLSNVHFLKKFFLLNGSTWSKWSIVLLLFQKPHFKSVMRSLFSRNLVSPIFILRFMILQKGVDSFVALYCLFRVLGWLSSELNDCSFSIVFDIPDCFFTIFIWGVKNKTYRLVSLLSFLRVTFVLFLVRYFREVVCFFAEDFFFLMFAGVLVAGRTLHRGMSWMVYYPNPLDSHHHFTVLPSRIRVRNLEDSEINTLRQLRLWKRRPGHRQVY